MGKASETRRRPGWQEKFRRNKWQLMAYDLAVFAAVTVFLLVIYSGDYPLTVGPVMIQTGLALVSVFGCRMAGGIYRQIWRYGGIQCYIRLLMTDMVAFCLFCVAGRLLSKPYQITFVRALSICTLNLLGAV